jgi:hypothetical protein
MNICSFNSIPCFDGDKFCGNAERNVVYLWTCLDNPCYVGITKNLIHERINDHLTTCIPKLFLFQEKLRNNPVNFKCYIIDKNDDYSELLRLETFYIKKYNTLVDTNPEWGYNLTVGGQGANVSEQTKEKISKSRKKRFESVTGDLEREKMSNTALKFFASDRGRVAKEKISNASKGRKLPIAQCELISQSKKHLFATDEGDETRKKLSIANTGKTHSKETRIKLSIINTGKKRSNETKSKMSVSRLGKRLPDEWKTNISNGRTGMSFNDDHKKSLSTATTLFWKKEKGKYKNEEDCREAMRIRMTKVSAARWGNKNWSIKANMGQI